MSDDQRRSSTPGPGLQVSVLGAFTLTHDGVAVALGVDARRVVAYLAVHRRPQPLATLAADLWAGVESDAALRLLDEAVADVDVPGLLVVDTLAGTVVLDSLVTVDLDEAMALVRLIPEVAAHEVADTTLLRSDVLPSWTAPWIAVERERFRQLRLNALEDLSLRYSAAGDHAQAVALARIAVKAAPSREIGKSVV